MKSKGERKKSSQLRSQAGLVPLLSALCVIIVLVHLAVSVFPKGGRIWGINQWSYFPLGISLLSAILVLAFFIPCLNESVRKGMNSLQSRISNLLGNRRLFVNKRKHLLYFLLSTLFFVPFWLLRDQTHFLGDGRQIIDRMNAGELSVNWAEPLEIFVHLKVFHWAHRLWQMDSATVYSLLSCLAGILFVFLAFLFGDFGGKERKEKVLIFSILLSMGSVQLFFGYVEHYSFLYVFTFGFILSAWAYLEGKLGWPFPLMAFILASLSHVSALHLLPSLLFIFAVKDKQGRSSRTRKALVLGAGFVLGGLIFVAYKSYSWTVPPIFVPLLADRYEAPGYLLFSLPHILDFLNQQLLTSPTGLVLILAPLACGMGATFLKNTIFRFLLLVSVFQLVTNFLLNPGLGASRDWDVFSPLSLGYTILGLSVFLHLLREKPNFGYLSLILVLTSLYSTVPWIILNSHEQKSVARFQDLLKIDPKRSANGHFILIQHFKARGMEEQAEKQDEKYRRAFPELVLFMQGTSLVKKGELERAEELFLQAEKLAPNLAHIHNNRGHVYLKRGQLDKAETKFKRAIQLSPHYSPPYANLANLYIVRQQYDQALNACKKAIRLRTSSPEVYSNAATIYLVKGRLSQAEAYYRKALSLDPEFAHAYAGLGDIYNRKAMPHEAIKMYRTAVQLVPDLAKAHFRLGMTYLSINSRERAKEELELYLKISPHGKNVRQAQEVLDKLR